MERRRWVLLGLVVVTAALAVVQPSGTSTTTSGALIVWLAVGALALAAMVGVTFWVLRADRAPDRD